MLYLNKHYDICPQRLPRSRHSIPPSPIIMVRQRTASYTLLHLCCDKNSERKVLGTFLFSFLGCKTIKGADPNALCIFPFRFRGKTHDTCIGTTNNRAWCSTKVDNLRNHVRGKWGYCGQGCPFPEIEDGKLFSNFITTPNGFESFQC